jgi:AmiR/NasT family two-component response regulator
VGWEATSDCEITIAQATGMVAEFASCKVDEALALIRDRARATGQSLYDLAAVIIERRRWPEH